MLPDHVVRQFYNKHIEEKVIVRNIHLDTNSLERSTGRIKPKYLLLVRRSFDLGVLLFYALTSKKTTCPLRARVEIIHTSLEYKDPNCLHGNCSYINLEKVAVQSVDDVISKIRDTNNTFKYVAKINQTMFDRMKSFAQTVRYSAYVSNETDRNLIRSALGEIDLAENFVAHFGI
jgi:hypothetical protein